MCASQRHPTHPLFVVLQQRQLQLQRLQQTACQRKQPQQAGGAHAIGAH